MILKILLNTRVVWLIFNKNIEEFNPKKKRDIYIFDDMIAVVLSNKNLNPIETELFIRVRKINIYFAFITQPYFDVPKNIRLSSTCYFILKIPNEYELQQTAINHSSDIEFKDFMNLYKNYTPNQYSFLVTDATLASDNLLRFRKNLLGRI